MESQPQKPKIRINPENFHTTDLPPDLYWLIQNTFSKLCFQGVGLH